MSLYRVAGGARRRTLALVAVGAAVAGGVAGFAVGRATEEPPTLAEQAAEVTGDLQPASNALELVTIEYPQAVRAGEIIAETEFEAARSHAATALTTLTAHEADLRALSATSYERALAATSEVEAAVEERAEPSRVSQLARRARSEIDGLASG